MVKIHRSGFEKRRGKKGENSNSFVQDAKECRGAPGRNFLKFHRLDRGGGTLEAPGTQKKKRGERTLSNDSISSRGITPTRENLSINAGHGGGGKNRSSFLKLYHRKASEKFENY